MKIVMNMAWENITKDQYEMLRKRVNWEDNVPAGLIVHMSSFNDKGIRVTDVWESADDFDNFINLRLMAEVKKMGITLPPQVEVTPLYALFTPGI